MHIKSICKFLNCVNFVTPLQVAFVLFCIMATITASRSIEPRPAPHRLMDTDVHSLSQNLLLSEKLGTTDETLWKALAAVPINQLHEQLSSDNDKKSFWVNIYNAATQRALNTDSSSYENRSKFFKEDNILVAGVSLSLDDIEHGILRKSSVKWSLGYWQNWFAGKFEKSSRVKTVDARIHFALNCGATSCPPIRFYEPGIINQQLDMATESFLTTTSKYDASNNQVIVSPLMSWFRGDFGGRKGTIKLLEKFGVIPKGVKPSIKYATYDWTVDPGNFIQSEN